MTRVVRDTVAQGYEFPVEVLEADLATYGTPSLTLELSDELPDETMEFFDGALREELLRVAGVPDPEGVEEPVELLFIGFR